MSSVIPFAPHFHNEQAAYDFVESLLWVNGRVCPHCGSVDHSGFLGGKSTRVGLYKCYECRKPFTVKLGTLFESSNLKLHLWLRALFLLGAGKSRLSSAKLHESLGVTAKTAWLVRQRITEAERQNGIPENLRLALANGRQVLPRYSRKLNLPAAPLHHWATAWNTVADHQRFTRTPTLPRRSGGAWWVGRVNGAVE